GRAARGRAAGARWWQWSGDAAPTRDCDRRRFDPEPIVDALHDARGVSCVRSAREAHFGRRAWSIDRTASGKGRMNISAPFIQRPIATTLLTIAVALAGGLAY